MKRRSFLTVSAALLVTPKILLAREGSIEYTPGLIEEKLAAGETVFVDYAATWCSTCKRQERIFNELRASNSEYGENICFATVDWDKYGRHEVAASRKVPRRSTLTIVERRLGAG